MKRSRVIAPLVALAAVVASAPAASAVGGTNNGGNFDCTAASPQVVAQFTDPKQISGTSGLSCPAPGANTPDKFGPSRGTSSGPTQPVLNTPCHFDFETPVRFRLNGSIEEVDTVQPTSDPNSGIPLPSVDPSAPTYQDNGWRDLSLGSGQATADSVFEQAGTTDFFWHWVFDGTWTMVGQQIRCVGSGPTGGWNTVCNLVKLAATACFDPAPPPQPPVSQGAAVGALGVNLSAFLSGQFFGGTVTSMPVKPNPGLTNIPTCFFVSGMTVNNQPADPQQDVFWERIIEGPQVEPEGRHVYFVFVIHVSYQGTTWDFGDGPTLLVPKGGSSPEAPPAACGAVADQQLLVAHTYTRYSTGDGFHVTATHHYGVDVTELWRDSSPNPHRLDFPDVIPPVDVPALPLPAYVMQIVQEEGVPIG
jgi:hypothetical protein